METIDVFFATPFLLKVLNGFKVVKEMCVRAGKKQGVKAEAGEFTRRK